MDQAEGGDYNRLNFVCQEQMKRCWWLQYFTGVIPADSGCLDILRWEMAEGLLKDMG